MCTCGVGDVASTEGCGLMMVFGAATANANLKPRSGGGRLGNQLK